MTAGKAIPILDVSDPEGWKLDTQAFCSVLDKVGNRPFAIYSMNGSTRSGKSFLLNYFLRHFDYQNNSLDELVGSFDWRSGIERVTVGINLWSKPYFVETADGEVAVLLMDTQGLFDKNTTYRQNAIIFTISCLLSSVMMFNHKGFLSEDALQHIQFFSSFGSNIVFQCNNDPKLRGAEKLKIGTCSRLLFLLRDFELPEYEYGLHTRHKMPLESRKNYFSDMFSADKIYGNDCAEENRIVRQRLEEMYPDVSAYLLPHPGSTFIRQKRTLPDEEFHEQAIAFVKMLVSKEYLINSKKKVGNKSVTAMQFKDCLPRLEFVCQNADKYFSDVCSMREFADNTQGLKAVKAAIEFYDMKLQQFISKHPEGALDSELENAHLAAMGIAAEIYTRDSSSISSELTEKYQRQLKEMIITSHAGWQSTNESSRRATRNRKIKKGVAIGGSVLCGAAIIGGTAAYLLLSGPLGVGLAAAAIATKMSVTAAGAAGTAAAASSGGVGTTVALAGVAAAGGSAGVGAAAVVIATKGIEKTNYVEAKDSDVDLTDEPNSDKMINETSM